MREISNKSKEIISIHVFHGNQMRFSIVMGLNPLLGLWVWSHCVCETHNFSLIVYHVENAKCSIMKLFLTFNQLCRTAPARFAAVIDSSQEVISRHTQLHCV